jgi:shikimate dehydrogenase
LSSNNKQIGLLGYPLTHSFSKVYFEEKFIKENIKGYDYNNFEISKIEDVENIINTNNLLGFNVTIPYKKLIIPLLDELDVISEKIGAVNTVKIINDTNGIKLKGYNTDVYGFESSIKTLLNENHKKALILGTGGASKAVNYVLENLGLDTLYVSRNKKDSHLNYEDLDYNIVNEYKLIVNTTPLGMYPNVKTYPNIPYEQLSNESILFDLIYNPEETLFLKKGKEMGSIVENGLDMCKNQAEKSWDIWNK